jgi:nitrogen fixation protein NifZ
MAERAPAQFEWGQVVAAAMDLFNDGSFPEEAEGALLVAQGRTGEVVRVGHYVPGNQPVYLVDFGTGRVVGCREDEIVLAGTKNNAGPSFEVSK